jgi:hypothetical protein
MSAAFTPGIVSKKEKLIFSGKEGLLHFPLLYR